MSRLALGNTPRRTQNHREKHQTTVKKLRNPRQYHCQTTAKKLQMSAITTFCVCYDPLQGSLNHSRTRFRPGFHPVFTRFAPTFHPLSTVLDPLCAHFSVDSTRFRSGFPPIPSWERQSPDWRVEGSQSGDWRSRQQHRAWDGEGRVRVKTTSAKTQNNDLHHGQSS
jgi:hypothetical protein